MSPAPSRTGSAPGTVVVVVGAVVDVVEGEVVVVDPSMAGWLFQVIPVSDQVVLLRLRTVPPAGLPPLEMSSTWSRSLALVTVPLIPDTVNRTNVRRTGELSTSNWPDVPKFVPALSLCT